DAIVELEDRFVHLPGLTGPPLRGALVGAEVAVGAVQPGDVRISAGHETGIDEATADEAILGDHVGRRPVEGGPEKESVPSGRVRLLPQHLIERGVEAARASLAAPRLEVGERLRVPVAAELVVARQAREESIRPDVLRPQAHFTNADSAGIVADAEIDTV